jgi:HSP20 family protein
MTKDPLTERGGNPMNLVPKRRFDIDSFFRDDFPSFRLLPEAKTDMGQLAVDIHETDDGYSVTADFPGIKKENIDVSLNNNVLTIGAEYSDEAEKKEKGRVIRQERRTGHYSRSFTLGDSVDENSVEAHFDNGVLTVLIPRTKEHEPKSTRIAIK